MEPLPGDSKAKRKEAAEQTQGEKMLKILVTAIEISFSFLYAIAYKHTLLVPVDSSLTDGRISAFQ